MPHVRSVAVGIWLTRGSRHEPAEHAGIAHFVEHMLFKGTPARSAEEIAQQVDSIGGQIDAFTSKEYAGYYLKVLDEHLPLAVDILVGSDLQPAVRRRRHRAREEGDPRRDQDGRGHARRSGPRALRGRLLEQPSARPADSRHAAERQRARSEDAAGNTSRRPTSRRISSSSRSAISSTGACRNCSRSALDNAPHTGPDADAVRAGRRAGDPGPQEGARAEPHRVRHRGVAAASSRIATPATRSTPRSAAR